jgi:hypothetical protein
MPLPAAAGRCGAQRIELGQAHGAGTVGVRVLRWRAKLVVSAATQPWAFHQAAAERRAASSRL